MKLPQKVKIREVGPRDGFQSWPEFVPTENKLEILKIVHRGRGDFPGIDFVRQPQGDTATGRRDRGY